MHNARYAILIDAGYLKQKFHKEKGTFPSALEIKEIANSIQQHKLGQFTRNYTQTEKRAADNKTG